VGKLPWKTRRLEYQLEYGTDAIEVHLDALHEGDRVAIVDDLIATGGTAEAAVKAVQAAGATLVGLSVLIELTELEGRARLPSNMGYWKVLAYPHSA
jgi:adenine phosphoribosyltransferase